MYVYVYVFILSCLRKLGLWKPAKITYKYDAKYKNLSEKFSPRRHMDKNDPPVALKLSFPLSDKGIHSPWFGIKLKEEADKKGAKVVIYSKEAHELSLKWSEQNKFLLNQLGLK